eukprot:TRINITY_DN9939_c0_g1_i18.p1 TRINITY_DN9939_c0_g1~~TRINITY_DN9939_c0_g1_i18.p1  ORF type:complete len:156 (-),score=44.47 TRINITY_DN9939_c0_g1_i18:790-1257(-)
MTGSILIIQIVEARNLQGIRAAYAEVNFDNTDRQRTQPKESADSVIWNEKLTFDVVRGNEVALISAHNASTRTTIGTATYNLKDYPLSELSQELWLPLMTKDMKEVGQVMLIVQWIQSRVKHLAIRLDHLNAEIDETQKELEFYKTKLEILHCKL